MDKKFLLEKLQSLGKNLSELRDAIKRAKENTSKVYVDQVTYLVSGISYMVTDIGHKLITMNQGKTFNNIILEEAVNVRDVFVKLGEAKIIPGETVPYLKKLITMANTNKVDIDLVIKSIPQIEEYISYIKAFLHGVELGKEEDEEEFEVYR